MSLGTKGKKTKARIKGTLKVKMWLAERGINGCEAKFAPCVNKFTAALAHDDKGRFLSEEELANPDPKRCIIACSPCHAIMEHEMPRLEMQALIREIASNRFTGKVGPLQMAKQKQTNNKKFEKETKKSSGSAIPPICPKCHHQTFRLSICSNCREVLVK